MHFNTPYLSIFFIVSLSLLLTSCDSKNNGDRDTLQNLDTSEVTEKVHIPTERKIITKSENDIRDAYINYLAHASKQNLSRSDALNRLASIEFKLSEQLLSTESDEQKAIQLANKKLEMVISLLNTSLQDYPDAKGNDNTYYQLAKAHDQLGNYKQSQQALAKLVAKYPKSIYYLESQFRLAEYAFSLRQYRLAEDKYTEVITSRKSAKFYEKSLYKRGWARFKQEFYTEAADDFVRVINLNEFGEYDQLTSSKKNLFDEYLRAMGLSFSYLEGAESLHSYLQTIEHIDYGYYLYKSLSDVLLKQERYNDAVQALRSFITLQPTSEYAPSASLQIIEIWKVAGFVEQRTKAFESFYNDYHPNSPYWKKHVVTNKIRDEKTILTLKNFLLTETATYHQLYQLKNKEADYQVAKHWYLNYLKHFEQYSQQDNIHFLLASLYAQHGNKKQALTHYQSAAFIDETIINKEAAYQTITLIAAQLEKEKKLTRDSSLLTDLLDFSILYAQQYPTDKRNLKLIAYASNNAYRYAYYQQAITLAELVAGDPQSSLVKDINSTKAQSYLQLKQYAVAERIYAALANDKRLSNKEKKAAKEGLALSIYYQGDLALEQKEIQTGIKHYARIVDIAPLTSTASLGLYDAIALSIEHKFWLQSIQYIKVFRHVYPRHKLSTDITKKLSIAYLNSKQDLAAAKELEKLSGNDDSVEYKMASLLKAAQLYQDNKEYISAIRSYQKYVKLYPQPYSDYMESLYQLSQLNLKSKKMSKSSAWNKKIFDADKQTPNNVKTDRTNFIASNAALSLARESNRAFSAVKLKQPLKNNLRRKKTAMQTSVNYYAKATSYGIADSTTEATYSIAKIYNDFSQSLLNSEVPKHLNADQEEQYIFLLEDQAFPFEEKAIEFYEVNMRYTNDGIYDQWISKSLNELQILFPLRYKRDAKVEEVINVLH